ALRRVRSCGSTREANRANRRAYATTRKTRCSRKCSTSDHVEALAIQVGAGIRIFPALLQSPLTDSNRRPPPYHGTSQATGRSRSQRFSPISAVSGPCCFAGDCHLLQPRGSIKAPSDTSYVADAVSDDSYDLGVGRVVSVEPT